MKKAKIHEIIDSFFKLDMRLRQLENLSILKECRSNEGNIFSDSSSYKKCKSSYSKIEIANLFYILMDEGILYFDLNDPKKNRINFQEFIGKNFTYKDNDGCQKIINRMSRQFSECKGYTYKVKQIKFLDDFIAVMQERKRRLESW